MNEKLDRRIIKSQLAIQNAFMSLILEIGFDAVTVKDITERANISRKTFYLHYVDKYDLLNVIVRQHIDSLASICAKEEELGYYKATFIWFRYFEEYRDFFAIVFASQGTVSARDYFLNYLMSYAERKLDGVAEEKKEIMKYFLGMAVLGVIESYVLGKLGTDLERIALQVGDLWKGAIQQAVSDELHGIRTLHPTSNTDLSLSR